MPLTTRGSVFRPHRLRHPLARERQAAAADRVRDEDRGRARWFAEHRRAAARAPAALDAGDHVRRVLRAVPRPPRRDRRASARRETLAERLARRATRSATGRCRARGRRRRHRRAGAPASPTRRATGSRSALRQALDAAVRWRYLARNPAVEPAATRSRAPRSCCPFTPDRGRRARARARPALRAARRRSPPRPGSARTNGSRSSAATSTAPGRAVARRSAASPTASLTPYPKTERSRRRVPLTAARARRRSSRLPPRLDTPLAVPRAAGRAHRRSTTGAPASGIRRSTRPGSSSAARTTCATRSPPRRSPPASRSSSWRALMGASASKMIDRTYGHLARDSEDAIRGPARRERRALWRCSGVGRRVSEADD